MPEKTCEHVNQGPIPGTRGDGCEECLAIGTIWVQLRICQGCGHIGCCDSSSEKHATKHFHENQHPVIQSYEPGEYWGWCYVDGMIIGPFEPLS